MIHSVDQWSHENAIEWVEDLQFPLFPIMTILIANVSRKPPD